MMKMSLTMSMMMVFVEMFQTRIMMAVMYSMLLLMIVAGLSMSTDDGRLLMWLLCWGERRWSCCFSCRFFHNRIKGRRGGKEEALTPTDECMTVRPDDGLCWIVAAGYDNNNYDDDDDDDKEKSRSRSWSRRRMEERGSSMAVVAVGVVEVEVGLDNVMELTKMLFVLLLMM